MADDSKKLKKGYNELLRYLDKKRSGANKRKPKDKKPEEIEEEVESKGLLQMLKEERDKINKQLKRAGKIK